jgi:hypothetical protein
LRSLAAEKALISGWQPRFLEIGVNVAKTGKPEDFGQGTPEALLVEYFQCWMRPKPNYGGMARCLTRSLGLPDNSAPRHVREALEHIPLASFEILGVEDTGMAYTEVNVKLAIKLEGALSERTVRYVVVNEDKKGSPRVRGLPGTSWRLPGCWQVQ